MTIKSINPYSQALIAEHEVLTNAQLAQKMELSEKAYKSWSTTTFQERADKMKKLANILRAKKEELGLLITNEMGKIISEGVSEVEKSAGNCDFYAENAEKMLKDIYYDTPFKSLSVYDPTGAIFAVMPWNYPFWQVLRYAAPAVMAGNVTILKHASNVQGCAKAIENVFLEAGFPEGVFQQVTISLNQVETIIASDIVSGVTLTGSEMAGSSVALLAG
ncbi:MAG: aldehyde dehydrogenase family protein, partial [Flavobacterium sp.]|nr:aldehyde dehydrogenase family protein [Flavobacterium sp.]